MPPLARRPATVVLISLLILCLGAAPGQALDLPGLPWSTRSATAGRQPVPVEGPSGHLQEVAAPGGVQQIRNRLAQHQPLVRLQSPQDGSVLGSPDTILTVSVTDWPLVEDADLGLGPHLALQIDDQPPLRFSSASTAADGTATLRMSLPELSPGSHRFTAYAAYPWGEAVKSPGASQQWRLHQLQALEGTQPERDDPWLVMISPAELGSDAPLLLDWLVWNAPLQNLRDGDGRWRLRITLNGDSFLVDRQEAIWLRQSGSSATQGRVQMELLDGLGEPITPSFNNQLRAIPARAKQRPLWLQSRLTENELARLLGEPKPNPEPQMAAKSLPTAPESPEDERRSSTNPDDASESKAASEELEQASPVKPAIPASAEPPAKPAAAEREATPETAEVDAKTTSAEDNQKAMQKPQQQEPAMGTPRSTTSSKPRSPAPLTPLPEEERLAPTTSLGGSARELLNPDGTQH